jgi:CheY-like chemotaxis protein
VRAQQSSRTVLVVEDEWLLRDEVALAFREDGWQVLESGTGEGALALLQAGHQIDVVFTDIKLAGYLSGWDVAEACRAVHPDLPIVYASGDTVDQARKVAKSQFFDKPYRLAAVVSACRKLR